jgi:hypothetical protein
MRILILGTTGVDKRSYIESVASFFLSSKGLEPKIKSKHAGEHIRIECIEDELRKMRDDKGSYGQTTTIIPFLDLPRASQSTRWTKGMEQLLESIDNFAYNSNEQALFLIMHGEYYRNRQIFSCFSWDFLLRFSPDVIVTLIDDVFDIKYRIDAKEKELNTKSSMDLGEILLWRSCEINLGDEIAHNLYLDAEKLGLGEIKISKQLKKFFRPDPLKHLKHFVIAVKHKPETLYRLLFEPKILRVYASFPISSTRSNPEAVQEINKFRLDLIKEFATLDSVTIDELRKDDSTERWPLGYSISEKFVNDSFTIDERNKYLNVICAQLEQRDYRLVEDCTCVAAYRPFFGGRKLDDPAHGVESEITRAFVAGRERVLYHPSEDGTLDDLEKKWAVLEVLPKVPAHDDYDKFITHLHRLQKDHPKSTTLGG